jgi:hypothetical protein
MLDGMRQTQRELPLNDRFLINVEDEDDRDNTRTYEEIFNAEFKKLSLKEPEDYLKKLATLEGFRYIYIKLDSEDNEMRIEQTAIDELTIQSSLNIEHNPAMMTFHTYMSF